jgi:hypothetical protein
LEIWRVVLVAAFGVEKREIGGSELQNFLRCVGCMSFYRLGEVSGEVEKKDGGVGEREGLVEY